jgi:Protein of unknown function (DUF2630)
MDDSEILRTISGLVDDEHRLRAEASSGALSPEDEKAQVRRLEEALDQCWDLLRRRQASRAAGQDPSAVSERPVEQVEGYLQ